MTERTTTYFVIKYVDTNDPNAPVDRTMVAYDFDRLDKVVAEINTFKHKLVSVEKKSTPYSYTE